MSGCILPERWSLERRSPAAIRLGCFIAIAVGLLNRCHRSPKVVDVFAIPTDNCGICHGDVEQGKQPGISLNRVRSRRVEIIVVPIVPAFHNSLSDLIPMTRWC